MDKQITADGEPKADVSVVINVSGVVGGDAAATPSPSTVGAFRMASWPVNIVVGDLGGGAAALLTSITWGSVKDHCGKAREEITMCTLMAVMLELCRDVHSDDIMNDYLNEAAD